LSWLSNQPNQLNQLNQLLLIYARLGNTWLFELAFQKDHLAVISGMAIRAESGFAADIIGGWIIKKGGKFPPFFYFEMIFYLFYSH
jgi:hypothetical protein